MLRSLHIENYALIQQTDIHFSQGFIAITGETGAGKSIILGALGLLTGQRADSQVLGDPEKKCIVEAEFDIAGLPLQAFFTAHDLDYDETLLLRREILPSGKSRAFANDSPVQLPLLKELGTHLIDIHSQHATLLLGDRSFQTELLDTIAHSCIADYQQAYKHYCICRQELEKLTALDAKNRKEADFLQFQFDELLQARLQADEQDDLEQESQLLQNTETIKETLAAVNQLCDSEEDSTLMRLSTAKSQLQHIASYHNDIQELSNRLDSALIDLQDIVAELSRLDSHLTYNPQRLEEVNNRLDLIYRLQKKHGVNSIAELLDLQADLEQQLNSFSDIESQIQQAMQAVDNAYSQMQTLAEKLTSQRHQAALQLQEQILPILDQLGMSQAQLKVAITPAQDFGPFGHDTIQMLFNANKGGSFRELAKVASGGEMSRLMLAIKSMITAQKLLPTIIFDEIDSGVSGNISLAVGNIMQQMAQTMQVITITHLPQIAARAQQHLKVYKQVEESRTISHLKALDYAERITEIATMLSSDNPTASALQTAKELFTSHPLNN